MANQLEKFYSSFSGTDTRSNKLLQDPKSFRKGSKNFRYNFQDEIQNRQGFQHKNLSIDEMQDIFEYKYKDVNTGQSKAQLLAVSKDGELYRERIVSLRFSNPSSRKISVYYDDISNLFKIDFKDSSDVLLGSVSFDTTVELKDNPTTTASIVGKINAITGATNVTASVRRDDGVFLTSSTLKAYLMDCCSDVTENPYDNSMFYWEKVPYPNSTPFAFPDNRPFITTYTYSNNPSSTYQGISYVNLNNCIYITDGGFPMKYDGKAVYRAGMPRTTRDLGLAGITFGTDASGAMTDNANYRYVMQLGYVDIYGSEVLGKTSELDFVSVSLPAGQKSVSITIPKVAVSNYMNNSFPIFSCTVDGIQNISGTGSKTLTVLSGHNVEIGQCLRIPIANSSGTGISKGISYAYFEVTNTSATTITINKTKTGLKLLQGATVSALYHPMVLNNTTTAAADTYNDTLVIQACWVPNQIRGTITEPVNSIYTELDQIQAWSPTPLYGAFMRIYRSKGNQEPIYELVNLPISNQSTYRILDQLADTDYSGGVVGSLTTLLADFSTCEELPRACKYISQWQGQLVQAGRPVAPDNIISKTYPFYYGTAPTTGNQWGLPINFVNWQYSEANLCDYQTAYWTDALTPEGFPQDAQYSMTVDTVFADEITGIAPNKEAFFIFKTRSTAIMTGTAANIADQFLEVLEADAGCSSHRSIKDVRGTLIWLDGINGFYACVAGRLPENIGWPIQDYQKINALGLNYQKAVAANFRKESLYVCSVEGTTFVFDYADNGPGRRACWYVWDGLDIKSIVATSDNNLLFNDSFVTWKMKLTKTVYDYTDHTSAINLVLNTAWLNQGFPTIDKHYVGLWINSIQGDFTLTVKQYGNFLEDLIGTQSDVQFIVESSSKKFVKAQVKASLPKLSSISWGMENSEKNKWVRIQGYELQYSQDFGLGEPKR